jgi:hypothetical protein
MEVCPKEKLQSRLFMEVRPKEKLQSRMFLEVCPKEGCRVDCLWKYV